jgi:hypothetical protein
VEVNRFWHFVLGLLNILIKKGQVMQILVVDRSSVFLVVLHVRFDIDTLKSECAVEVKGKTMRPETDVKKFDKVHELRVSPRDVDAQVPSKHHRLL